MKNHSRRAFTLIELLVVIAIIAILAAILFPVFAQAKRAAKGAVAESDAKQLALAEIMYSGDYDDVLPPVVSFNSGSAWDQVYPFTYLCQPYMKSWDVMLDPTGPTTAGSLASDNGGTGWQLYGLWGMPPERNATNWATSPDNWTFGQHPLGAAMTGGTQWYYDGIGGVGLPNDPSIQSNDFMAAGYKLGGYSSLSTTAIASPADQVMIAQSGASYDFLWANLPGWGDYLDANDTADNFDTVWGIWSLNPYGQNYVICGPMARKNDPSGPVAGYFPTSGVATQLPSGITVWAGTDGHVKASPWRQLMGTTIDIAGGKKAIKAFWPSGS